jgi:hypothetical protein
VGNTTTLSATYASDPAYATSTSPGVTQVVTGQQYTLNVLSFSSNPVPNGTAVAITAKVSDPTNAIGVPTGTITFTSGGSPIVCTNLFGGDVGTLSGSGFSSTTTCIYTPSPAGTYTIRDVYSGDVNFGGSFATLNLVAAGTASATPVAGSATSPAVNGRPVVLTAAVSGGSGTPTGTVTFKVNSGSGLNPVGCPSSTTVALNGSGVANCSYTPTSTGSIAVVVVYNGDATYASATSSPYSLTVVGATASTTGTPTLTSPASQPVANAAPVTVSTTVSGTGGPPTGTVVFTATIGSSPATVCGPSVTLVSGVASCTFTPAFGSTGGTVSVVATYSGSSTFASSTSSPLAISVLGTGTLNTFTLTSNKNPTPYNSGVVLTAALNASSAAPTGSVTFYVNGSSTGWGGCGSSGKSTVAISPSTTAATCSYTPAASGTFTIQAAYSGDANFASVAYTSGPSYSLFVTGGSVPAIALTSSANPAAYGATVTFSAAISGALGTPTGTVNFTVNGLSVGCTTQRVVSGIATCSWTAPRLGGGVTETVHAVYSGDATYTAKNSPTLSQVENGPAAPGSLVVTSSKPLGVAPGSGVSVTATLTAAAGAALPTGRVTFSNGGTLLCTASIGRSGIATCTATVPGGTPAGTMTVTASYSGDPTYATDSATYGQIVS